MDSIIYIIIALIVVAITVVVIIAVTGMSKSDTDTVETYAPTRSTYSSGNTSDPNGSNQNVDHYVEHYGRYREGFEPNREKFLAIGEHAYVDSMGDMSGSRIMTNGIIDGSFDDVKKSVMDNRELKGSNYVLGAGRGDNFDNAYQAYRSVQEIHDQDPTGVRNDEEKEKQVRQINSSLDMSKSNFLTRAGATKSLIKMEPLGTVGVMEDGAALCPERDRSHTIYTVSHAVHIPGYKLDTPDVFQQFTKDGSGWNKNMSTQANTVISSIGNNTLSRAVVTNEQAPAETFSASLR